MITIFLDSNVLISALIGSAHSAPVMLVDWLASSRAAATHFVTGDKRLLAEIRAAKLILPPALTPREMLEVLLTQA